MVQNQLFRISGSQFFQWLCEPETFLGLSRNKPRIFPESLVFPPLDNWKKDWVRVERVTEFLTCAIQAEARYSPALYYSPLENRHAHVLTNSFSICWYTAKWILHLVISKPNWRTSGAHWSTGRSLVVIRQCSLRHGCRDALLFLTRFLTSRTSSWFSLHRHWLWDKGTYWNLAKRAVFIFILPVETQLCCHHWFFIRLENHSVF